jgi:hypothetical protein
MIDPQSWWLLAALLIIPEALFGILFYIVRDWFNRRSIRKFLSKKKAVDGCSIKHMSLKLLFASLFSSRSQYKVSTKNGRVLFVDIVRPWFYGDLRINVKKNGAKGQVLSE